MVEERGNCSFGTEPNAGPLKFCRILLKTMACCNPKCQHKISTTMRAGKPRWDKHPETGLRMCHRCYRSMAQHNTGVQKPSFVGFGGSTDSARKVSETISGSASHSSGKNTEKVQGPAKPACGKSMTAGRGKPQGSDGVLGGAHYARRVKQQKTKRPVRGGGRSSKKLAKVLSKVPETNSGLAIRASGKRITATDPDENLVADEDIGKCSSSLGTEPSAGPLKFCRILSKTMACSDP
jgi:hypothetical protein